MFFVISKSSNRIYDPPLLTDVDHRCRPEQGTIKFHPSNPFPIINRVSYLAQYLPINL